MLIKVFKAFMIDKSPAFQENHSKNRIFRW